MAEARLTDEALGRALAATGRALDYPRSPSLTPGVVSRLERDRAAGVRPPFPRIAVWGRRRVLALAAAGVLALLALAFGARFVLGAVEVRVQPGATPSGPPIAPDELAELGGSVPVGRISSEVGFDVGLPAGPAPDEAYVVTFDRGEAAVLAWRAGDRYPPLPGTPWGLVLMGFVGGDEVAVKDVLAGGDLREVTVGGRPAFWIDAPHRLILRAAGGDASFLVEGNVLIWTEGGITYRLETTLGLRAAIALAESVG